MSVSIKGVSIESDLQLKVQGVYGLKIGKFYAKKRSTMLIMVKPQACVESSVAVKRIYGESEDVGLLTC